MSLMFGSTRDHFDKRKMIGFKIFEEYTEDNLADKINDYLSKGWTIFNSGCALKGTSFNNNHWVHMVLYEVNYK